MKLFSSRILYLLLIITGLISTGTVRGQVKVVQTGGKYTLMRNGQPYYIKGLGGDGQMQKILDIGGNSVRTWGVERAQEVLDEAQRNGLTVMLGFWMQTERQGFDYNNTEKVKKQYEYFKSVVDKYKNHPALLIWGIGNELDLQYSNTKCWNAVEDIARYIHQTDPNHPTSTVTAGLDSMEVQLIKRMAPDIDIYGVNTYGDIGRVPEKIAAFGWDGPYMITEWGPDGWWEAPNTDWKVAIEQTSREKKQVYYDRFTKYIGPFKDKCLGSYAFFWGAKQEYTESWFGLLAKDGTPTEAVDALEMVFRGKPPVKPAPTVMKMSINGKTAKDNIHLKAGEVFPASIDALIGVDMIKTMPDSSGKFQYSWKVLAESTDKKSGGDAEEEAMQVPVGIKHGNTNSITFRAPSKPGAYRLFVTITYHGKLAYANLPFFVDARSASDGQSRFIEVKKQDMDSFNKQ